MYTAARATVSLFPLSQGGPIVTAPQMAAKRNVPIDQPQSISSSVMHWQRAIDREDNVEAMFRLAEALDNSWEGIERGVPHAAALYDRAIREGAHDQAMSNLAFILENGTEGVPQDAPCAAALYERLAAVGYADSIINLALLLGNGAEDVSTDDPRALALLERLASANHVGGI